MDLQAFQSQNRNADKILVEKVIRALMLEGLSNIVCLILKGTALNAAV